MDGTRILAPCAEPATGSELRTDPITGRRVIVAPLREARPSGYEPAPDVWRPMRCPFCPGNEADTPPPIAATRADGTTTSGSDWAVRVVPNKYPALEAAPLLESTKSATPDAEFQAGVAGHGVCEVIVETRGHSTRLADLAPLEMETVLALYRDRLAAQTAAGWKSAVLFKNQGQRAGATLEHCHAQVVALPVIPAEIGLELAGGARAFEATGRCAWCDMGRDAQEYGVSGVPGAPQVRSLAENPGFVALVPFAARVPYECLLLPRRHAASFAELTGEDVRDLAGILLDVLGRIAARLGDPAYNLILHTAPAAEEHSVSYHWHFEILPRLAGFAGFELATGIYVNSVRPEEAAARLRALAP